MANKPTTHQARFMRWQKLRWSSLALAGCLGWVGCTSTYYRKQADKDVYKIIDQAERQIFGGPTTFTIDTPYSPRNVQEILAGEIVQARQQPDELFINIEEALDLAVRNSREYQTEKERLYLTALSLTGARYEFSPQFFARSTPAFERTADGEKVGTVESDAGVTQFLKAGGNLGLAIANDFLRFYTGDPRKEVTSMISVNLAQPLLRGAGAKVAAENLKQSERNVIYAIRSFAQYQRQFAIDIVIDYFELLQDKDQLKNAYADYQRRLETIQYTEARGEAGKQSQLEVDEARTEELTAKNSYIIAATTFLNNLDRFKITLGLPLTTKLRLDDQALIDLRAAGLLPLDVDNEKAFHIAVENQLELLNDIDRFEDSQRQVYVAANRLKANLNLLADASLDSKPPTDYTQFNFNEVRAGVGLALDLPIDRLVERNDYRATLVSFESAIRTLSRQLDVKMDQIDRGLRNLESLRRSFDIQTNSLTITERRVAGEQMSLQAGRRSVLNVREAQDALLDSQNNLTQSLVGHLAARLQLAVDIGILNTNAKKFWARRDALTIPLESIELPKPESQPAGDILPPDKIFDL